MLINHLSNGVLQQDHVLVERLDLTLQFDSVHKIKGDLHILLTESVQELGLQLLLFYTQFFVLISLWW